MGLSNWRARSEQDTQQQLRLVVSEQIENTLLCSSSPWLAFFCCFCRSVHGQGVCLWFMSCLQFTEFPTVQVPVYYDWVWYWLLKTTEEFYVGWHCFDCVAFVCLSTHHLPGELSERDQKPLQGGCRHARENSTCRLSHSRRVSVDDGLVWRPPEVKDGLGYTLWNSGHRAEILMWWGQTCRALIVHVWHVEWIYCPGLATAMEV